MANYGELGMGAILGIGGQAIGNSMQMGQSRKLQKLQIAGQKEMGQFNQDLAYKMWEKTNYDAQRKQMEKAGLNVGLMYGGGGAGGGTATATAGTVGKDSANAESGAGGGMAMMLQAQNMQAQKELTEAQTVKTKSETAEVEARTPTYEKGMQKTDAEMQEIASRLGVNVEQVKKIMQDIEESKSRVPVNEAQVKGIESNINKQTAEIPKIKAETAKIIAEGKAQLIKNTYLDRREQAELDKVLQDIATQIEMLKLRGEEVDIRNFSEKIKADYPSLFNVAGRTIDSIMRRLAMMMSGGESAGDETMREIPKR